MIGVQNDISINSNYYDNSVLEKNVVEQSTDKGKDIHTDELSIETSSYLIELDENGDVENYTVTTHGTEISSASGDGHDRKIAYNNSVNKRNISNEMMGMEEINLNEGSETEPGYMEAMAILSSGMRRI